MSQEIHRAGDPAEALRRLLTVSVVIPVLNEASSLRRQVVSLRAFLDEHIAADAGYDCRILVADNGSTDGTLDLAQALSQQLDRVGYIRLEQRGRGRALRRAWLAGETDLVAYMDVDLSTNLRALRPLLDSLRHGYEVATGSRLMPASRIRRSLKREVLSRSYNTLIRLLFWHHFSDAQCGFKALTRRAVHDLVPLVEDRGWFFDTELLLLAEHLGYPIAEVPVEWVEDLDTRVRIVRTAVDDIRGLLRMRRKLWTLPRHLSVTS